MSRAAAAIADVFLDASVEGFLHARQIGGPMAVDIGGSVVVPMASVYKAHVAAAWARAVEAGELDPRERHRCAPDHRLEGPTGIAALADDIEMSSRDLVRSMLSVSDNAAADIVFDAVTPARMERLVSDLELRATTLRRSTRESLDAAMHDTATHSFDAALIALASIAQDQGTSEYDPAHASATSAFDATRLLTWLWQQEGRAFDWVRASMAGQAWRHRIASGFPHDDVVVAGKTGSLGALRHEIAVVTFPDELPIAVAIFTRAIRAERHQPRIDAAIGEAARIAVHGLREPRDAA
ncbi:serine hydrolase [Agrococcus sp. Marseille-P2731]|uniref:serine hydrolase n=1 Tax=Agrococcus sp. Marseille-P2731 TaxID=1841862 RepID=UPI00092FE097|nr:serine hydrolase [Agrococcus sp. Marseille-P2731]